MKIIIEGSDGSGKSTLARYLSATTGYPVVHRSKPKDEEDRLRMYKDYVDSAHSCSNEIWDRAFYSEIVYGKVMRDQSCLTIEQMLELEKILGEGGCLIIFCTGNAQDMWENSQKRGETYITSVEQIWTLDDEYKKLFFNNKHLVPIVKYEISYGKVPTL